MKSNQRLPLAKHAKIAKEIEIKTSLAQRHRGTKKIKNRIKVLVEPRRIAFLRAFVALCETAWGYLFLKVSLASFAP